MNRLSGKVALITGASRGMGAAHARMFVAEGAQVIMTDLDHAAGTALAEELGSNAVFLDHDVAHAAHWAACVAQGEAKFGAINVLVNNAGILGPIVQVSDMAEDDYYRVCAVNQHSVFLGMKAVIPSMLRAGGGSIINISSISGLIANYGTPSVAYVASKFAVRGMTKAAAMEYGKHNIRVNSVHPGFIETPMLIEATDEESRKAALPLIPLGRFAAPSDVSNLVVFLASDESSYITASEHVIDAGMSAH